MSQLIAIALGGAAGAVTRFLAANGVYGWLGREFPHGTLFVNVSGSFLMGLLTELLLQRFAVAAEYRAAILVGFLGAFTTFSTFALETLYLLEEGSLFKAFLNILLSTVLCVMAVWIGLIWGRTLFMGAGRLWDGQGLAYLVLVLGWFAAFLIALLATFMLHYLDWPVPARGTALILMLGGVTVAATLWTAFRLTEVRLELGGLFTLFVLNGLAAAAVLWLATYTGSWLWQLNLSR